MHSYLLSYFLALVAIDAVSKGDIPKFVRRNLFGSEFLSVFSDVSAEAAVTSHSSFEAFWSRASTSSLSYTSTDRGLRNIGALVLGALPAVVGTDPITLREFQIDDAVIRGLCPKASMLNFEISQLDIRGSDLSAVTWSNSTIGNLIADDSVRVSPSFPVPSKITLTDGEQIAGVEDVAAWLSRHGRDPQVTASSGVAPATLKAKPIYKLLMRAARMRQYWLRSQNDKDIQASKVVDDPNWDTLTKLLAKHGYLREETRQASGRASNFYHIRHRESLLSESVDDLNLKRLLEDLQKA
jgi:hypothetical protein